jgi:hypothetical protein
MQAVRPLDFRDIKHGFLSVPPDFAGKTASVIANCAAVRYNADMQHSIAGFQQSVNRAAGGSAGCG